MQWSIDSVCQALLMTRACSATRMVAINKFASFAGIHESSFESHAAVPEQKELGLFRTVTVFTKPCGLYAFRGLPYMVW